jgi:hypothetical protein
MSIKFYWHTASLIWVFLCLVFWFGVFVLFFETGSHYVAQAHLELAM